MAAAVAAAIAVFLVTAPTLQDSAGRTFVSGSGVDSGSGSAARPFRTIERAVAEASPGETIVLAPGTYGRMGTTTQLDHDGAAGAPITITASPGQARPVIKGYVRITASHLRLHNLVFDGPTGNVQPTSATNPGGEEVQISIMYGNDIEIARSEVRENRWHAGIFVARAENVRLLANHIHDNGNAETGANLDHGIYWSSGTGTIADNLIQDNVAYGIQLYPDAANVTTTHNTITGHGRGGIIVAENANHNQITNNLIADNARYGIRAYELSGTDNTADNNLLWHNTDNLDGSGLKTTNTIEQDPAARPAIGSRVQHSSR